MDVLVMILCRRVGLLLEYGRGDEEKKSWGNIYVEVEEAGLLKLVWSRTLLMDERMQYVLVLHLEVRDDTY
jgi:hypothetical protein